jgi:hypothetical protein
MTPKGRLRKAVKLLDQIDEWNDRTNRLPDYIRETMYIAQGLIAVTIRDLPKAFRGDREAGGTDAGSVPVE